MGVKMVPVFKDYLWGGTRLVEEFGKKTSLRPVAESWEVSCHPDGLSKIANGTFAGKTLAEMLQAHPEYLGTNCAGGELPVLIKLIDARDSLSVQVHPPDSYARKSGQQGKNEMWYVMDASPGATLIAGCGHPVSPEEFATRLDDGTILEIAHKIPIQKGDCYIIPAGMLHAIGAGALIAEVQQNSNLTYRVYDFGRLDGNGNPRPLHLKQAMDVTDTGLRGENMMAKALPVQCEGADRYRLTDWPYFTTTLLDVHGSYQCAGMEDTFNSLLVVEGSLDLQNGGDSFTLKAGESAFIPAMNACYTLAGIGKALLVEAEPK